MSATPLSFQMFNNINNVVVALHGNFYKGGNKSSRYKIGKGIIAVIENNMLERIIDFNKNRIIKPNRATYTVQIMLLEKETTLAEDVIDKMTDAIKLVTTDHIIKAYEAANMLPDKWLQTKIDLIYKYSKMAVAPIQPS